MGEEAQEQRSLYRQDTSKRVLKRLKDTELMKDNGVNVMQGEPISEATLGAVHGEP